MSIGPEGAGQIFWPLTRAEQEASRDALLAGLVSVSRARGDELDLERDLFSAISQLLVREGMALYLTQAVVRRAKAEGIDVVWPANCGHCQLLWQGRAPSVQESSIVRTLMRGPVCHPRWRRYPTKVLHDIRHNGVGWAAFRTLRPERDIIACHATDVLEEHARCVEDTVKYTLLGEWFFPLNRDETNGDSVKPVAERIKAEAVTVLENAFAAGGESLPVHLAKYFAEVVSEGSCLARIHLDRLLARPNDLPQRLWTGSGAYIWARLLRHAVRRVGGKVTGHEHGTGESIITYFNTKTFSDLESADRFVTFNSNQRRWLESTIDERFLVPLSRPEILVPDYRPGFVKYAGRPLRGGRTVAAPNSGPIRVMYVAPIYCGFNPRISHHNADLIVVDWQARLLAKLRDWGCEILFKPHPEGEQRPPQSFEREFGARILSGPFEDVWSQADIYIFDWKSTTAFSTAISTGLPIVLVDFEFERFAPEMQMLVEQNCTIVPGHADSSNRLQVDWDDLHRAIHNYPHGSSKEIREKAFRFA